MGLRILFMLSFKVCPKSVRMLRGREGMLFTADMEVCKRAKGRKLLVFVRSIVNDEMKHIRGPIAM